MLEKENLIKSMIQAIPSYVMQCYLIPKKKNTLELSLLLDTSGGVVSREAQTGLAQLV